MYIYSKKSRRRMHAIPAAIALLAVTVLWLVSGSHQSHAAEILSAQQLAEWDQDCRGCEVDIQYDVLQGNVIRMASDDELSLSRRIKEQPDHPGLKWQWSVDSFVDGGKLIRLSVFLKETEDWPARTLHYVWDSNAESGAIETRSDFEHVLVVTGADARAEHWYSISRDLNADWSAIYNEAMPAIDHIEVGLGMPEEDAITGAFIDALTLSSLEPAERQQPAIAINE
ncbi:DUF3047 domain-containing protein [Thalassolituus marinus]|uniref:DUF3047 domain-containing protein n=1 Tax=Thalassolituus marinus TaxID=671053 RepID=A0ABS7ZL39_9GAMM|nr:DUF3047 domain-containing protein [Thalassolituus marinus]MCA6062407.1 DUF3047 domain-containing protein [Thalassolituus marinus]